ncbi:divergent polysaccharide deacetylase family protein [Desulfobulbus propionicus]
MTLALVLAPERIQAPRPSSAFWQAPIHGRHPNGPAGQAPAARAEGETGDQRDNQTSVPAGPSSIPIDNPSARRPRVAIIIDDMGYNLDIGRQLIQLALPLSFSFLPAAPHTPELAAMARIHGRTVLVHLPMEPKNRLCKQEPVTLEVDDTIAELQEKIDRMLAAVPLATGANNHMGSRFTESRQGMRQVLACLRGRALFFIDSATSVASVAETVARQMHIPAARRRVFLDNDHSVDAVCRQLGLLARMADHEGQAIAIGHPHQDLLVAMMSCADRQLAGVELVGVDALIR